MDNLRIPISMIITLAISILTVTWVSPSPSPKPSTCKSGPVNGAEHGAVYAENRVGNKLTEYESELLDALLATRMPDICTTTQSDGRANYVCSTACPTGGICQYDQGKLRQCVCTPSTSIKMTEKGGNLLKPAWSEWIVEHGVKPFTKHGGHPCIGYKPTTEDDKNCQKECPPFSAGYCLESGKNKIHCYCYVRTHDRNCADEKYTWLPLEIALIKWAFNEPEIPIPNAGCIEDSDCSQDCEEYSASRCLDEHGFEFVPNKYHGFVYCYCQISTTTCYAPPQLILAEPPKEACVKRTISSTEDELEDIRRVRQKPCSKEGKAGDKQCGSEPIVLVENCVDRQLTEYEAELLNALLATRTPDICTTTKHRTDQKEIESNVLTWQETVTYDICMESCPTGGLCEYVQTEAEAEGHLRQCVCTPNTYVNTAVTEGQLLKWAWKEWLVEHAVQPITKHNKSVCKGLTAKDHKECGEACPPFSTGVCSKKNNNNKIQCYCYLTRKNEECSKTNYTWLPLEIALIKWTSKEPKSLVHNKDCIEESNCLKHCPGRSVGICLNEHGNDHTEHSDSELRYCYCQAHPGTCTEPPLRIAAEVAQKSKPYMPKF